MPWDIQCNRCDQSTRAREIADLICNHRDKELGFFLCSACGSPGHIERRYKVQDPEESPWEPFLRGALLPKADRYGPSYQPFVFMVSGAPDGPIESAWFCYYKDLRKKKDGRLKMGHGPGGPPVFDFEDIEDLLDQSKEPRRSA